MWRSWNKADKTLLGAGVIFLFALCLKMEYQDNVFAAGFLFCAEAALVGGIADWFAVTALFEKPLGFPWHTAILPRRRQSFIDATGRMLQQEFFGKKALLGKVKNVDFAQKLANWLQDGEQQKKAAAWLAAKGISWLQANQMVLGKRLGQSLQQQIKPEALLSRLTYNLAENQTVQELVAQGAESLSEYIQRPETEAKLLAKLEAYKASKLNGPMAMMMAGFAESTNLINLEEAAELIVQRGMLLAEQLKDCESEEQQQLLNSLEKIMQNFEKNSELKQELAGAWLNITHKMDYNAIFCFEPGEADLKLKDALEQLALVLLADMARQLGENQQLREKINNLLYQLMARGVLQAQEMLGTIVGDVLNSLTDKQMNSLIYDKAEPDLLWIRMNGSIVGSAIGLVIFTAMQLAGM